MITDQQRKLITECIAFGFRDDPRGTHKQSAIAVLLKEHDRITTLAGLVPGLAKALWVLKNNVENGLPHGPDEESEIERTCFLLACTGLLHKCNSLIPCVRMGYLGGDAESKAAYEKNLTLAAARAAMEETTKCDT